MGKDLSTRSSDFENATVRSLPSVLVVEIFYCLAGCVVSDDEIGVRVMPKRLQRLQIAVILSRLQFLLSIAMNSSTKLPSLSAVAFHAVMNLSNADAKYAERAGEVAGKEKPGDTRPGCFIDKTKLFCLSRVCSGVR